jgi:hypothetical protein
MEISGTLPENRAVESRHYAVYMSRVEFSGIVINYTKANPRDAVTRARNRRRSSREKSEKSRLGILEILIARPTRRERGS